MIHILLLSKTTNERQNVALQKCDELSLAEFGGALILLHPPRRPEVVCDEESCRRESCAALRHWSHRVHLSSEKNNWSWVLVFLPE
jgi:hypothetical protein